MLEQHSQYELVVRSHLGRTYMMSLPVVDSATSFDAQNTPITTMTLVLTDQAELIGLLNELHGGGLTLLSFNVVIDRGA